MSSIDHIFDNAFRNLDELETLLQYLKTERQHVNTSILPESRFKLGWRQLYALYHSEYGHCLKRGCSAETLTYYANNKVSGMHMRESRWFWKTVLKIAVKRNYAKEIQKSSYRRYKFL